MKALALLPVAGALVLYGSAFSGVWTPPGLEDVPTYEVVLNQLPGKKPVVDEPISVLIPISEAHQLRPHGVSGDWGTAPVFDLPERKAERPALRSRSGEAAGASKLAVRPPRTVARTTTQRSTTENQRPSRSYTLAGSRTEHRFSN